MTVGAAKGRPDAAKGPDDLEIDTEPVRLAPGPAVDVVVGGLALMAS